MDSTHAHLMLTHFPIIGTLIGTALLLLGVWKKNPVIQEISLAIIVFMAIAAIPVFLTGEPAEESVENLPGVIESIIEEHEEAAELAFWTMIATGVISLISIAFSRLKNTGANAFIMLSLVLSIITTGLMARTGYLGGQIRHSEIRDGNANIVSQPLNESGEEEDD